VIRSTILWACNTDMLSIHDSEDVVNVPLFRKLLSCTFPFIFGCKYLKDRKVMYNLLYIILIAIIKIMKTILKIQFSNFMFSMQMKSLTVGLQLQMQKLQHLSPTSTNSLGPKEKKEYSIL